MINWSNNPNGSCCTLPYPMQTTFQSFASHLVNPFSVALTYVRSAYSPPSRVTSIYKYTYLLSSLTSVAATLAISLWVWILHPLWIVNMSDAERKRSRSVVACRILSMVITHHNNTVQNFQKYCHFFIGLEMQTRRTTLFVQTIKETCRLATNILSF